MATTSISLGEHWEAFIRNEIDSGRYGSASEVVKEALRTMEEREQKLEVLRAHLALGAQQSAAGDYIEDFSIESLIGDLDTED